MADRGAGVRNFLGAATTLSDMVITGNSANIDGGGIYNSGDATIIHSTFSDNSADDDGGGIFNLNENATISGSTISGNSASDEGGGIFNLNGEILITGSTITDNSAADGGGIFKSYGSATIAGTILSGNSASSGSNELGIIFGAVNLNAHNVIGDNSQTTAQALSIGTVPGPSDLLATSDGLNIPLASILDTVLADNGGPTLTHALVAGSPAIDARPAAAETYDQRGAPFLRDDGNGIDIGAYERQSLALTVDVLEDAVDGDYSPGNLALREALELTNANPDVDAVDFDPALAHSTVSLDGTPLTISDDLTLTGLGADQLTIDAGDTSRVLLITGGTNDIRGLMITGGMADRGAGLRNDAPAATTLSGMAITGNSANDYGGAIFNSGDVTIIGSTVSGNTADRGGGIFNLDGDAAIAASTISGNTARFEGGGIFNRSGDATVTRSTIEGNTAAEFEGGGIFSYGFATTTIENSTIAGNTAIVRGGGIGHVGLSVTTTIAGSTITGNSANSGGGIGIWNRAFSAAISIADNSITDNAASDDGGGIYAYIEGSSVVTVSGNTISGNSAGGNGNELHAKSTTVKVNGYNLIGDDSQTTADALFNVTVSQRDLLATSDGDVPTAAGSILGPLANNGGPTRTHALMPGSPALDAADSSATSDQRGLTVPVDLPSVLNAVFGNGSDIGAVEAQTAPSADFVDDDLINGRDFLAWQAGFGISVGAVRADGNSDDDGDVDVSDLAAWSITYGQADVAAVAASRLPARRDLIHAAQGWDQFAREQTPTEATVVNEVVFSELSADTSSSGGWHLPSTGDVGDLSTILKLQPPDEKADLARLTDEMVESVFASGGHLRANGF